MSHTIIARATGGPDGACCQIKLTDCSEVTDDILRQAEDAAYAGYRQFLGEDPQVVKAVALPFHRETDDPEEDEQ